MFGDWMEFVPQRLGQSDAIDSALDCFLDSSVAYTNSTAENLATTDRSNVKAIQKIRTAILADEAESVCNDALIAIAMLQFVEVRSGDFTVLETFGRLDDLLLA